MNVTNELLSYRNPEALKFDINSIRSIYVLRKGSVPKRLEDALAVFVTPNSLLAKAAYTVGQNHNTTKEVSSTITDYSLANIAWLKAPLGAPELPTKELLASCYAAMEPSRSLWHKYLNEIEETKNNGRISADEHALLRVSPIAGSELMNLTLGEENNLTGGSIRTILDRVKATLTHEKDKIINKETEKYEAACSERDYFEDQNKKFESNIFWLSGKLTKIVTVTIEILCVIILFFAILVTTFVTSPSIFNSKILSSLSISLLILAALFGFLNWYKGISLKVIISGIEKSIHKKIFLIFKNILTKNNSIH